MFPKGAKSLRDSASNRSRTITIPTSPSGPNPLHTSTNRPSVRPAPPRLDSSVRAAGLFSDQSKMQRWEA